MERSFGYVFVRNLSINIILAAASIFKIPGFLSAQDQTGVVAARGRDMLPVAGFIVSSIISSTTLVITILVVVQ